MVHSPGGGIAVRCSCGADLTPNPPYSVTLDALIDIADKHIERADRGE